jgi:hypothetical protein
LALADFINKEFSEMKQSKDQIKVVKNPCEVRALRMGFYGYQRRRAGEKFIMDEADIYQRDAKGQIKKDQSGEPVLCSWIEVLSKPEKVLSKPQGKPALNKSEKE